MVPAAGPNLDETNAALDEPSRDQQLIALGGASIKLAHTLRLFVEVEGIGGFSLHLERHFIRLQPSLKLRILLQVLAVQLIELMNQVELTPLFRKRGVLIMDVLD